MATLGRWTGGTTSLLPTTTWAAPNGLISTQQRNDGSAYSWTSTTSTLTLPSSGLADGYLVIVAFEFEDTSNGRHNPQGRFIQASGTGNFVSAAASGYNRDNSEDRSYVRVWSFIDSPSASATIQFQWRRDTDAPTGGTVNAVAEVIPFYYSDIGLYTSNSNSCPGGTSPTKITGWSGVDGTNVTLASDTVTADPPTTARKIIGFGGCYWQGIGNARTQRWMGFDVGGFRNSAKACAYARNGANADIGGIFSLGLSQASASTWEIDVSRGQGVSNGQGGADVDGNTTGSNAQHAMVIMILNADAEAFWKNTTSDSANLATTGPVDLAPNPDPPGFVDTASFTRNGDNSMNLEKTADYLFTANISGASNNVSTGQRWTAEGNITVNGTEDADTWHGNYLRNNQGSQDTFGWSANLMSFVAGTLGDDIGLSVTELVGSEGGGGAVISPGGWTGFMGLNLDTLEESLTNYTLSCESGSFALTGTAADLEYNPAIDADGGSLTLTGQDATLQYSRVLSADGDTISLNGSAANLEYNRIVSGEGGTLTLTGQTANLEYHRLMAADGSSFAITGQDVSLSLAITLSAESGSYALTGQDANLEYNDSVLASSGAFALTGTAANLEFHRVLTAEAGSYTSTGQDASLTIAVSIAADGGSLTLAGQDVTFLYDRIMPADGDTLVITGTQANLEFHRALDAEAGSYSLTGQDAGLTVAVSISAEGGSYTLAGQAANLEFNQDVDPAVGVYALTGSDANLEYHRVMAALGGTLVLTGQDAQLDLLITTILTAESGSFALTGSDAFFLRDVVIPADTGSYGLTGGAANLEYNRTLTVDPGAYSLTGQDAQIGQGEREIVAEPGSYSHTGQDVGFTFDRLLSAEPGSLVLGGLDAALLKDYTLDAEGGALVYTGFTVPFTITIPAGTGVYAYSGVDADLLRQFVVLGESGNFVISGQDATFGLGEVVRVTVPVVTKLNLGGTIQTKLKAGDGCDYKGSVEGTIQTKTSTGKNITTNIQTEKRL